MKQKDDLYTWRRYEHQQDQIENKVSSFEKNLQQFFMIENVLHNRPQWESLIVN